MYINFCSQILQSKKVVLCMKQFLGIQSCHKMFTCFYMHELFLLWSIANMNNLCTIQWQHKKEQESLSVWVTDTKTKNVNFPFLHFTDNWGGSETCNAAQQVWFHWKLQESCTTRHLCMGSTSFHKLFKALVKHCTSHEPYQII